MQLQQSLDTPRADSPVDDLSDRTINLRDKDELLWLERDVRIEIDLETRQRVIVLPEVDPTRAANAPTQIRPGRLLVLPASEPNLLPFSHQIDFRWLQRWRHERSNLRYVMLNDRPLLEKVVSDVVVKTRFGSFVELAPFVSAVTLDWLHAFSASGAKPNVELHVSDAAVSYEAQRLISPFAGSSAIRSRSSWAKETPKWSDHGRPRLISWLGTGIGELAPSMRLASLQRLRSAANAGDKIVLGIDKYATKSEALERYRNVASSLEALDREHLRVLEGSLNTPSGGTYGIVWNDEIDALETRIVGNGRFTTCSQRFPVETDQLIQEASGSGFAVRSIYGTSRDSRQIVLAEAQ